MVGKWQMLISFLPQLAISIPNHRWKDIWIFWKARRHERILNLKLELYKIIYSYYLLVQRFWSLYGQALWDKKDL